MDGVVRCNAGGRHQGIQGRAQRRLDHLVARLCECESSSSAARSVGGISILPPSRFASSWWGAEPLAGTQPLAGKLSSPCQSTTTEDAGSSSWPSVCGRPVSSAFGSQTGRSSKCRRSQDIVTWRTSSVSSTKFCTQPLARRRAEAMQTQVSSTNLKSSNLPAAVFFPLFRLLAPESALVGPRDPLGRLHVRGIYHVGSNGKTRPPEPRRSGEEGRAQGD